MAKYTLLKSSEGSLGQAKISTVLHASLMFFIVAISNVKHCICLVRITFGIFRDAREWHKSELTHVPWKSIFVKRIAAAFADTRFWIINFAGKIDTALKKVFFSGAICNSFWTMTIPWKSTNNASPQQGFYVRQSPELLPRRFDYN